MASPKLSDRKHVKTPEITYREKNRSGQQNDGRSAGFSSRVPHIGTLCHDGLLIPGQRRSRHLSRAPFSYEFAKRDRHRDFQH